MQGEIKTPPFSSRARVEAGYLLRRLQIGEKLSLPYSRPMPSIGVRCHELRIDDEQKTWRIVYRIDADAIMILEVFEKRTRKTPKEVIENCKRRIRLYNT
ncbi:MAG TPA: type II toxin-antitoxin system RelE/ParE family toxin [Bacteroidota bacterium]